MVDYNNWNTFNLEEYYIEKYVKRAPQSDDFDAKSAQMKKEYDEKVAQMKKDYDDDVAKMNKEYDERVAKTDKEYQDNYNAKVAQMEKESAERRAQMQKESDERRAQLQKEYNDNLAKMNNPTVQQPTEQKQSTGNGNATTQKQNTGNGNGTTAQKQNTGNGNATTVQKQSTGNGNAATVQKQNTVTNIGNGSTVTNIGNGSTVTNQKQTTGNAATTQGQAAGDVPVQQAVQNSVVETDGTTSQTATGDLVDLNSQSGDFYGADNNNGLLGSSSNAPSYTKNNEDKGGYTVPIIVSVAVVAVVAVIAVSMFIIKSRRNRSRSQADEQEFMDPDFIEMNQHNEPSIICTPLTTPETVNGYQGYNAAALPYTQANDQNASYVQPVQPAYDPASTNALYIPYTDPATTTALYIPYENGINNTTPAPVNEASEPYAHQYGAEATAYEQAQPTTYQQYDQAQYNQAQYDQAQYDQAQYNQAQYNQAQYNQAQYDQAQYDKKVMKQ